MNDQHKKLKAQETYQAFKNWISQYTPAENNAVAGMVTTQAVRISSATLQRTFPKLSEEPTPMMEELTTCVVLTGSPPNDAPRTTMAEVSCAAKLCTGRIL